MNSHKLLLLIPISFLFLVSPALGQQQNQPSKSSKAQQVMVTPDSYVEEEDGNEITYQEFVKQINTGNFFPVSIKNECDEHVGFRLSPRSSQSTDESRNTSKEIKLESTKIQGKENLQFIYRDYLFAPIEFYNGQTWITKWMVYDTGTFIPVVLLPEVAKEIGTVQKIKMGEIKVLEPPVGSYEFNDLLRSLNRYRDKYPDEFGEYEIAGIAGLPLLSNYLVSIQVRTGEVTLRPLDSEQRTLRSEAPIAQAQYKSEQGNIWFPVTINGKEGFAHLDTGNPYFDVYLDIIPTGIETIDSYLVGKTDVTKYLNDVELRHENMEPRYQGTGISVISAFGNLAAKPFVITIDPLRKKIYFEKLLQ